MLVAEVAEGVVVHDDGVHLRVEGDIGGERAPGQVGSQREFRVCSVDLTAGDCLKEILAVEFDRFRFQRLQESVRGIGQRRANLRSGVVLQREERPREPDRVAQALRVAAPSRRLRLVETGQHLLRRFSLHDLFDELLGRDEEGRLQRL